MVNSPDFGKRIQKIMNHYAISASSFADYMGVGRSSISHILSGRNKPSLDFVMKIVDAYKEVDLQWLLYGTGTFPISEPIAEKISQPDPATSTPPSIKPTSIPTEQDLFSETIQPNPIKEMQPLLDQNKKVITSNTPIDRIVVFYSDGTFDSYQMKKT